MKLIVMGANRLGFDCNREDILLVIPTQIEG